MMLRAPLAGDDGFTLPFTPSQAQAPDIARLLVERYGENTGPRKTPDALQALLRRLHFARYDWDKVSPADRLDVAWVLWEGTILPAEHEAFLRAFLHWLETPWRRLQATRLAAAWAVAFGPDLASIRIVGDWLKNHSALLPDPWPVLAAEFNIFSLDTGPATLADAFLAGEESASSFFQRLRLPAAADAAGGLALATLAAATARVASRLAWEPRLAARLCALSLRGTAFLPDAVPARPGRRGRTIREGLAETLLLSWQRQVPPLEVKAQISAFLLRHYGDVRVTRQHWTDMPVAAVAILHRWLTEQTVAAYFRIAGRTKSADAEKLAERQEFWMSRLDRIDDAWLMGAPRTIASLGAGQPARGSLAVCRPDQSALLLRIGGLTILESSHETSESVWLPGNPLAPPLYRRADQPYWHASLARGADFSSADDRKSCDSWEQRLARYIERHGASQAAA